MMTRQDRDHYLHLCQAQSSDWLRLCLAEPTRHMTPRHRRLVRLVLKLRGRLPPRLLGGDGRDPRTRPSEPARGPRDGLRR